MKGFLSLNIVFLFGTLPMFAMENLPKDELSEVKNHLRQIELAREVGPLYFIGGGQTMSDFIDFHSKSIEKIFNKYSIQQPHEKTLSGWLNKVKSDVEKASARFKPVVQDLPTPCANQDECDITGA